MKTLSKLVVILNITLLTYSGYMSYVNYKQKQRIVVLEDYASELEFALGTLQILFDLMDCSQPKGQ